ncbi:tannase/feruloyl esterase family alpha/beta hydrolase [Streptomyces sp. NPDC059479]|uniref:tannase/feruloyl esterase family alpha/beta hydrolase n=1 Tax=Streptomyces sp. NPDC059479 TaxID=3346848 RepID=UPI0036CC4909
MRPRAYDQIVPAWRACDFDARALIGDVVTAQEAAIINRIWKGPRGADGKFLWYGPLAGTPLDRIAGSVTNGDGTTSPQPSPDALTWITHWVLQDPTFDWRTLSYDQFADLFERSVAKWESTVGAADPDLSAFRAAGGKMVITHGTFDSSIQCNGETGVTRPLCMYPLTARYKCHGNTDNADNFICTKR